MILQWGNVVLFLDNAVYVDGFKRGRELYARDCRLVPSRAAQLKISEVLKYVVVPDGTGYRFDVAALERPEAYLGFLMGYLAGSLTIE